MKAFAERLACEKVDASIQHMNARQWKSSVSPQSFMPPCSGQKVNRQEKRDLVGGYLFGVFDKGSMD